MLGVNEQYDTSTPPFLLTLQFFFLLLKLNPWILESVNDGDNGKHTERNLH